MRILVGILCYDRKIDCDLMKTLLLVERQGKHELDYLFPVSSHLARNRNYVCAEALRGQYDAALFLDADISIPDAQFIDKLIACGYAHDAKVVGGAYRMKKGEEYILIAGVERDGKLDNIRSAPTSAQLVAGLGTGCMLIYREALEKVADPWFTILDKANLEVLPEDFNFCASARAQGIRLALCPHFETRHWGQRAWVFEPCNT